MIGIDEGFSEINNNDSSFTLSLKRISNIPISVQIEVEVAEKRQIQMTNLANLKETLDICLHIAIHS